MLGDYSHLKVNKVTQILWVNLTIMGVLFLHEKHSSIKNGNTWVNDFSCPVFFSHGASNSYCFLIPYPG